LRGRVAWQPTANELNSSWASGASVTRALWHTPLTASWQHTQPELWTYGTGAAAEQTSFGVDLAPSLRSLIGPSVGGGLTYEFQKPDDRSLASDQSLMLNLTFGW
jgi:hypothetical protein